MLHVRLWRKLQEQSGFTLIELLGVAIIIIVLTMLALPVYADVNDRARESRGKEDLRRIEQALERYYTDHQEYPDRLAYLAQGSDRHEVYLKSTEFNAGSPEMNYYYAFIWVSNGERAWKEYVLAVPADWRKCEACNPQEDAPEVGTFTAGSTELEKFLNGFSYWRKSR
ncbi:MAG TPA: type II secretion system protein [Symbiobacteriaceae bacterium]|nr:type II secretion system protein [Symbiobacteriaceae bacterium]